MRTHLHFLLVLTLAAAAALAFVCPGTASARFTVGVGEQNPAMYDTPAWQSLGLRHTRYLVPWDYAKDPGEQAAVHAFMTRARSARQDVLVSFTASRGCYVDGRYARKRKQCRAPSPAAYGRVVRRFDAAYPWVRTYSAWNEANHSSQPTYRSPRLAARYYDVLRRRARAGRFRVMALDVLDTSNMLSYVRRFQRAAKRRPTLWGLHNYGDVNRRTARDTRRLLAAVPGEVWMTETGGIVKFAPRYPRSLSRAANRTRWMFQLADRYDRRRSGLRSRITRLYAYTWFGVERTARFDAGLVNADGSARPAYGTFRRLARKHR